MVQSVLLPRLGLSCFTGASKRIITNSLFTSLVSTSTSSFSTTAISKSHLSAFGQQGILKSILSRRTMGAFVGGDGGGGSMFGNSVGGGVGVGGLGRSVAGPVMFVRGMAKKKGGRVKDKRIRMIRYSLNHPLMPRPLRFGTMRMLRHWTIHRAWLLYQRKRRTARELELERQWNKMREACEELARVEPRLYRIAIAKREIGYFPRELRIPTDTPPREGWNHGWVRPVGKA